MNDKLKSCPRTSDFIALEHVDTHERVPICCNTYRCPVCGPVKIWKLKKALTQVFSSWKPLRFWTFTMKNDMFETPEQQYKVLMEAWRYFITYVRRSKALSKFQSQFRYVKVHEQHKSGYYHLHVVIDRYIDREVFQRIWERIIQEFLNRDTHVASVHVKIIPNAKCAAYYISKYITKQIHDHCPQKRFYSTSYHMKIFEKNDKTGEWFVVYLKQSDASGQYANFINHEKSFDSSSSLPLLVHIESNFTDVQPALLENLPFLVPDWTQFDNFLWKSFIMSFLYIFFLINDIL